MSSLPEPATRGSLQANPVEIGTDLLFQRWKTVYPKPYCSPFALTVHILLPLPGGYGQYTLHCHAVSRAKWTEDAVELITVEDTAMIHLHWSAFPVPGFLVFLTHGNKKWSALVSYDTYTYVRSHQDPAYFLNNEFRCAVRRGGCKCVSSDLSSCPF